MPAPDRTAAFLAEMLDFEVERSDRAMHLTAEGEYGSRPPSRMLTLRSGPALEARALVFQTADAAALDEIATRLGGLGVRSERDGGALTFVDPAGVAVRCAPAEPPLERALAPSPIRPRRLGHVNLKVAKAADAAAFYRDALALRLSEQVGDLLFFLRVGSEHHNLGFRGGAERANVHHVAFEIKGWESFRVICDHIAERGHVVEYGPGRHGPGHNLFVYIVEPTSGLRLELYADMAHIADESSFEPMRWESVDRARTVNRWGPQPPDSFLK